MRSLKFFSLLFVTFQLFAKGAPTTSNPLPLYEGKPGTAAGQQCVNPNDGAVMVWVPAGYFLMGSSDDDINNWCAMNPTERRRTFSEEKPQHRVYLDGFWIYQNLVTVAQYKKYCDVERDAMPEDKPAKWWKDQHPMVLITWQEAHNYAKWVGGGLPTEAQWEKAARGIDGRLYPWGNDWDPAKLCCSIAKKQSGSKPVGSFPEGASPFGCLDMAGNVWEWCEDWYGEDYYANSPELNPTGPDTGADHVSRGGSWDYDNTFVFRCTNRSGGTPTSRVDNYGFRCIVSPPGQSRSYDIFTAIQSGDQTTLLALLKDHPDLVSSKDDHGDTPLHHAAFYGHKDMAYLLLDNKADVDARNNDGSTPLHEAATKGNTEVVDLLLANKADINAKDHKASTPLHDAVFGGHLATVVLLLKYKADITAQADNGEMPLHAAAEQGNKEMVALLLANNAPVNAKDHAGQTPLHYAVKHGYSGVSAVLLDNGADINAKNNVGATPLHYAAGLGPKEIVVLLILHHADTKAKTDNGDTPLQAAEMMKRDDIASLLQQNREITPLPIYNGKPGTKAGDECVNSKDDAVMVWVPAGYLLDGQ